MAKSNQAKRRRRSRGRPSSPATATAGVAPEPALRPAATAIAFTERLRTGLSLTGVVSLAVLLRSVFPYRSVLGDGGLRLPLSDAWYHFRLIEHLVANFPQRLLVDPFALHPGGQRIEVAPLLDYLVAGLALLLGRGDPSGRLVEQVAAWTPALLGGATVIAVFLLTRSILGRRTALLAALFVAIQPGHFLNRSLLGSLDHHVLEALLSTLLLWLVIEAVERPAGQRGLWATTAGWGVAAGIALAAYLLSWSGGVLWCGLVALWLVVTATWELLGARSLARLAGAGFITGVVAWLLLLPFASVLPRASLLRAGALTVAGVALLAWSIERIGRRLGARGWQRSAALVGSLGLLALAVRYATPELFETARAQLDQLRGSEASRTVIEARPLLLFGQREPSLRPLWLIFGTSALIAAPGLLRLLAAMRRGATPGRWLLLVWTGVTLWITLQQNRFGYYFSLPLAVLAAYTCDGILELATRDGAVAETAKRGRSARRTDETAEPSGYLRPLGIAIVVLLVVYPNLGPAVAAGRVERSLTPAWSEALDWLRDVTPEPWGDEAYLAPPERSAELASRDRGWGVLAWWDYGYWIAAAARRPPSANPTQSGAGETARFLLATELPDGLDRLDRLGARYVLVDEELPFRVPRPGQPPQGKFDGLATWAEQPATRFRRVFRLRRPDGTTGNLPVYLPEYYRTMLARLYLFGGGAVEPEGSSYVLDIENGEAVKVTRFDSEQEARLYQSLDPGADRRLVGIEPNKSPIRLEPMSGLQLRFQSRTQSPGLEGVPQIRIFERSP